MTASRPPATGTPPQTVRPPKGRTTNLAPNLILMLHDHLPNAIKSVKAHITRLESSLVEARAELEVLVRHAAVANISLEDAAPLTETAP